MKKYILPILFLLIFVLVGLAPLPVYAQETTYLLIGASNAINGNYAVARAFEARMSELTGQPVTVIVCAQNGSGLTWAYNNCLGHAVSGVIFVNGEYEARYGTPWTQPFLDLRNAYAQVPAVFTSIHPRMPGRYIKRVAGEQNNCGVPYIVTDDLYLPLRSWHYREAELIIIGRRLADVMWGLP